MPSTPPLDGFTVLDLSSLGPASRCSRILADYGATVIKIGPMPRKGSVQIQPPYFSYRAGRGTKRIQVDFKTPEDRIAFPRMAADADGVIESFRPGVADRPGIGFQDVEGLNPGIVYCSTGGYGQDEPYAQWAGHDLNYRAVAGFLGCSGRRADGGPALLGATVADSAGGGMQAAIEPAFYANLCRALGLERWIPHQTGDARQEEIRSALMPRPWPCRYGEVWASPSSTTSSSISAAPSSSGSRGGIRNVSTSGSPASSWTPGDPRPHHPLGEGPTLPRARGAGGVSGARMRPRAR